MMPDTKKENCPQTPALVDQGDVYGHLISLWRLQEHILHTYHGIFLGMNSALLAIGVYLVLKTGASSVDPVYPGLTWTIIGAGAFMCFVYFFLFWDRALCASFFPAALEEIDAHPESIQEYAPVYSKHRIHRKSKGSLWLIFHKRAAREQLVSSELRKPARVMLGLIPIILLVVWIMLACVTCQSRSGGIAAANPEVVESQPSPANRDTEGAATVAVPVLQESKEIESREEP